MSMKIYSPEHFAEVTQFALANGCLLKLAERLDYLTTYGDGTNVCHLHKDFAPNSFEFVMLRADGSRWFNGGLIYCGPGQPADGSFPSLTVSIGSNPSKHAWTINT